VVSPNRNRRTSRSRRLARSWGRGSDRRCGAAGNPPPFRPVPPRVRFFDRTGAATPPSGMGGIWGRFWAVGRRTKESRRKPWRFCCAWAITSARSAGSCGVLRWRFYAAAIPPLALFCSPNIINA
jgi:hypothetical protein